MHVMVDIETQGRMPTGHLSALGAAEIDLVTGAIGAKFLVHFTDADQSPYGLTKDLDTLEWWGRQDPEIFASVARNARAVSLEAGFEAFMAWLGARRDAAGADGVTVWGKPGQDDLANLEFAYGRILRHKQERAGADGPKIRISNDDIGHLWKRKERHCMTSFKRTCLLLGIRLSPETTAGEFQHDPLHDAIAQGVTLSRWLKEARDQVRADLSDALSPDLRF